MKTLFFAILSLLLFSSAVNTKRVTSSRLPRTSASQHAAAMAAAAQNSSTEPATTTTTRHYRTIASSPTRTTLNALPSSATPTTKTRVEANQNFTAINEQLNHDAKSREEYIFNVFEVIVATLESKLQRIDNLDKAVEHLMRRVEMIDARVTDNIDKTESVMSKLRRIDQKLEPVSNGRQTANKRSSAFLPDTDLDLRLISLDKKVSDIDTKINSLKSQIDTNMLQNDADINAEASEKRATIHNVNMMELAKSLNIELLKHISKEFEQIKINSANVDKKITFHINIVGDSLTKIASMVKDVHEAIVDPHETTQLLRNYTTTTARPSTLGRNSKIDLLVRQMTPIVSVSEKMDEVWNVVVGTKSSVDDLVPKSNELLSQTHRQERAIGEIHNDLRMNTNKIIENLGMVEKRLKKQEDDVATLAQRPVPAELLLDPTIDRLIEYDPTRYNEDLLNEPDVTNSVPSYTTVPAPVNPISTASTVGTTLPTTTSSTLGSVPSNSSMRSDKRGIIFPSVKNKPSPPNTTFTTDTVVNIKDVKGYSCLDLFNSGMRQSGVYYLQIRGTTYWFLKVFCEQELSDGGWTVIQRRDDYGEPRENFNRDWTDYKNGFGDPHKEFWMGNENIFMLTNNEDYTLRIELEDFEGNKRYAQYSHFKIYSEAEYYKLEIDGYEGNAGDSLNDPWYGSNNSPFSTYNRDNDRSSLNCASMLKGGWWWKSCGRGLNGLYLNDAQDLMARQGIVWFRWRGWDYTLKRATMMIKPKGQMTNM